MTSGKWWSYYGTRGDQDGAALFDVRCACCGEFVTRHDLDELPSKCPRCGEGAMTSAKDFADFNGVIECRVLESHLDKLPEPDTLYIRMRRGEKRIAKELSNQFGGFKRVVIDVDGEQYEFSADSLIRLLEGYEGANNDR